jgi:hypothetical protein
MTTYFNTKSKVHRAAGMGAAACGMLRPKQVSVFRSVVTCKACLKRIDAKGRLINNH